MPEYLASELIVLEANTGTEVAPVWVKLVCLSEKSFSGTTASVDIQTDCGDQYTTPLPSKKSWTMGASGVANMNPSANEGSYDTAYDLWENGTVTGFRERNIANTYVREGKGFITDISETSSAGDYLNFSLTIQGSGAVSTTPSS